MATKKKSATAFEVTINTTILQDMISRVTKGASNNKLLPLTQMLAIELKDNQLRLITSDGTNYLYIIQDKVEGNDFYAVVPIEVFSKLISRLTCESVSLSLTDNLLSVVGNGNYTIELPLDEEGLPIKYPDLAEDIEIKGTTKINLSTLKLILQSCKSSLATTLDEPCYTGYYAGENVIATDSYKIAAVDVKLFDEPVLVSPALMNLFEVMRAEKVGVDIIDDDIIFTTPDCIICGKKMEYIEDFQVDAIMELVNNEFDSICKISKAGLISLLDRISLFVGPYDNGIIRLTFTKDGINIESSKANGIETIPYIESSNFKAYTCVANIEILTQQVKANPDDVIELHYGDESSIKFTAGNVIQIVALSEEDELNAD